MVFSIMTNHLKNRLKKVSNRGDVYIFESYYPEENSEESVKDIVDCLESIGVFDGVNK